MTTLYVQRSQPHPKGPVMVSPHPNYPESRALFWHANNGLMTAVESHWDSITRPVALIHGWLISYPDEGKGESMALGVAEPPELKLAREVERLRALLDAHQATIDDLSSENDDLREERDRYLARLNDLDIDL